MNTWRLPHLLGFLYISSPTEAATVTECIVCRGDWGEVEVPLNSPTASCKHQPQVCRECLQRVILEAVKSGQYTSGIFCPSNDCSEELSHSEIQKWAARKVFERYDNLMAQGCLKKDGRYVVCLNSTCGAGQVHLGGEYYNIVKCYACGTKQCYRHEVLWHEGLTCEQWDEHQRTITDQQELMTDEWIQTETKSCPGPGCGKPIEKIDGCDIMTCKPPVGCGHKFCWECLASYFEIKSGDNSKHYDHCRHYTGRPGGNPASPGLVRRNHDIRERLERLRAEWQAADGINSVPGPGPRTRAYINYARPRQE